MDTFSLTLPLELEEKKYTFPVTKLEVLKSVSDINEPNITFTIYTPGYWKNPDTKKKYKN